MTWEVEHEGRKVEALFFLTQIGTQAPLTIKLHGSDDEFVPFFTSPDLIGTFLPHLCNDTGFPPSMFLDISRAAAKETPQSGNLLVTLLSLFKEEGLRFMLNPVRVSDTRTDFFEIIEEDGVWRLRQMA